ncbi:MAG: prepilin-type N-terminal cleavage/methylation domain-containing protein [Deltaproteobacteria bacterium]|nr:prepilin-type N-terminal cleavage/methylation domain-containing protein [Deltaproteobacteria bacterium]
MRARGFSLIEILVAASLLAIIGGLLVQSLSSSIDAKEAIEGTSNRYHLVRSAMSRMVDEISQAYLSSHAASTEPRSETGFLGERDHLDFTAFGYVPRMADEKKGDSRQLAYYLDSDPKTSTQSLFRREQGNLDDNFEEGGRSLVLLSDVRELSLQYWDATKEEWLDKWDAQSGDPNQNNKLPVRVRIRLTATMADGEPQTFTTQTKVWMPTPIKL